MQNRFSRTELLIGKEGQEKLKKAKVAVCGIGGVGSAAAEALARAGVGNLVLLDDDVVNTSNINRQLLALQSTVGQPKVWVMQVRIADINPDCQVEAKQLFLTEKNIAELPTDCNFVIDAIDYVPGKIAIIQYCRQKNIKIISSMGTGNKLQPELLQITDLAKTSVCPLAKVMRKELKKLNIEKGVSVIFSLEEPKAAQKAKDEKGRQITGSISFVPPVAGMMLAGYVIRQLLGYTN